MNRRHFLAASGAVLAVTGVNRAFAGAGLSRIGLQLFSIPKMLQKNVRSAMEFVAGLRYSSVEPYGPYPFSAPETIAWWNSIAQSQLGFSGSGFFGMSVTEFRAILKDNGLTAPSMHTDYLTLQKRMAPLAEAAHALGATYVVLPALDTKNIKTLDDFKRTADTFNAIGASARRHGVKFAYHNHGYGLREMQGEVPLHLLMRQTDPNSVFFEMDTYWTTAGGGDPVQLLRAYPTRYKMLHLKDMKKLVHFKGDGGDPSQWEALFPYMTSVGDGVIDMKGIVRQAQRNGVEYYFVEEDTVANPQVALKRSAHFLLSK